jgi:hypothetical protein
MNQGNTFLSNRIVRVLLIGVALVVVAAAVWLVVSPGDKQTPEPQSQDQASFSVAGTDALIEYGITSYQVAAFEEGVKAFVDKHLPGTDDIVIQTDSVVIEPQDPESTTTTRNARFTIAFGARTYTVKFDYFDLSYVQFVLYDDTGKNVYDSGVIDGS